MPHTAQGRNEGGKGGTIPRAPNLNGGAKSLWGAPKSPNNVTNRFFNTVYLLPKDLRFEHGAPNLLLAPGAIWSRYAPAAAAAVAKIALHWRSDASFPFMLLFTLHSTKLRSLPLLASLSRSIFCQRCLRSAATCGKTPTTVTWSEPFEELLPCYCYAIKSTDRTIRSQALQPVSAGEVADMSELQAYHFMKPAQRIYLLCSVSYRQINCCCKK